jgi:hypothetical protein
MSKHAYLTRHAGGRLTVNVYDNGSREHQAVAPEGLQGIERVTEWADANLKEHGYTRTVKWDQPPGFDKELHDYKATVVPTPKEFDPELQRARHQVHQNMDTTRKLAVTVRR